MLVLFDTNLVLRLAEPKHAQHATAVEAVKTVDSLGHEAVVVPQVVYEFWAVATRPIDANGLGLSSAQVQMKIDGLLATICLLRDERTIYERWRQLVMDREVKGKQVHDARLVAAMLRHDVKHLLTFNPTDFTRYSAINVVEPHLAGNLGPTE